MKMTFKSSFTVIQKEERLKNLKQVYYFRFFAPLLFALNDNNHSLKRDKTLAIREILIDNDLETTDRELDFEIVKKTNLIKVKLK